MTRHWGGATGAGGPCSPSSYRPTSFPAPGAAAQGHLRSKGRGPAQARLQRGRAGQVKACREGKVLSPSGEHADCYKRGSACGWGAGAQRAAVGAWPSAEEGCRPVIGHGRLQLDAGKGVPERGEERRVVLVPGGAPSGTEPPGLPRPQGPQREPRAGRPWSLLGTARDGLRAQGQLTACAPRPGATSFSKT